MKCKFCNNEATHYCKHCNSPLCEEHAYRGRNRIVYCPTHNSEFYREVTNLIAFVNEYMIRHCISMDKKIEFKTEIMRKIAEW